MLGSTLPLFFAYRIRTILRKRKPVIQVCAVVVEKHTLETFSSTTGLIKPGKYVDTFQDEGKQISFYVSELTYSGYQINEEGTLVYQGDRLIDFHGLRLFIGV